MHTGTKTLLVILVSTQQNIGIAHIDCQDHTKTPSRKSSFSFPVYSNIKKAGAQAENACKIEDRYGSEKDEGHYIYHE